MVIFAPCVVNFFVSYRIIMFLGSKMGYLGMTNAMAQFRGLSAHSVTLQSLKSGFLDIFSVCLHFLTIHSVPLSFWDMILNLQTSYIFSGILLKIIFSILFVVPSKKSYEWAEGIKKGAEGPLTCAVVLGIPKNPMLDPKIIKI